MTLTTRPITASDKERWLLLWQGYLDFYKTAVAPEQTERTWNRIMDPEFNMKCAVAESDGMVIGFTTYNLQNSTWSPNGHCYLEDLFVRPEHRGKGLGKALLAGLARRCVTENLARLEWSVLDWNEPSITFYKAMGAEMMDGWTGCRVSDAALWRLADHAR